MKFLNIYEDMWNENIKRKILTKYNLIRHPLRETKIIFDDGEYTILNIFKRWSNGWYLSMEINYDKNYYVEIPFQNINCEDQNVLEKIQCVQKRTKNIGV